MHNHENTASGGHAFDQWLQLGRKKYSENRNRCAESRERGHHNINDEEEVGKTKHKLNMIIQFEKYCACVLTKCFIAVKHFVGKLSVYRPLAHVPPVNYSFRPRFPIWAALFACADVDTNSKNWMTPPISKLAGHFCRFFIFAETMPTTTTTTLQSEWRLNDGPHFALHIHIIVSHGAAPSCNQVIRWIYNGRISHFWHVFHRWQSGVASF